VIEVQVAAAVEAFHGLVEIPPRVHFQALLFPLIFVGGCDDSLEDFDLFADPLG
jgi:hypothetical protein